MIRSRIVKAAAVLGAAGLLGSGGAVSASAATAKPTAVYDAYGQAIECCTAGQGLGMALWVTIPRIPVNQRFAEVRDSHGAVVVEYRGAKHAEYVKTTAKGSTLVSTVAKATQFYAFAVHGTKFSDLAAVDSRGYHPARYGGPNLLRDEMLSATVNGHVVLARLSHSNTLGQEWAQGS